MSLPTYDKSTLLWTVAILSFGLTALIGSVAPIAPVAPVAAALSGAIFVLGFFILIPLIWVLGEDFPLVESESADGRGTRAVERESNPVAELRRRYATGELTEAEFERRLERLLETEELEDAYDRVGAGGPGRTRSRNRPRDASRERDREPEYGREFE